MWQRFLHKWLKVPYVLANKQYQSPAHADVTIIMLHGIGSSGKMWAPTIAKLPSDVRIITLDLLGFGLSPKPKWNIYSARTQADSIATTLFSLKITGPLVVVGHSLGALVAVEFAKRYPLMTKSVVLVSPPLYKPDRNPSRFDFKPEEVLRKMYDMMAKNPLATERVLRTAGKYNLVNKGFSADNVNVPAYLATLETAIINQQSYSNILRIKCPVHIISGKLDAIVLDQTIHDIVSLRPNVTHTSVLAAHEIVGLLQGAVVKTIKIAIDEARQRSRKQRIDISNNQ